MPNRGEAAYVQLRHSSQKTPTIIKLTPGIPKYEIYEEYQNQKTLFRILYGKTVPKETDEEFQLHRHKVCACMTVAIIKCRPLFVERGFPDDTTFTLFNAPSENEQLALAAGLSFLRAYILADGSERERHKYFIGTDIYFPPAFKGIGETTLNFDTHLIWSLYDSNVINGLSTPLLADLYFLIDRYHEAQSKINELREKLGK